MKSFHMSKPRSIVAAGALVLAGFGGGAALAAGGVADAASSVTNSAGGNDGHHGETPLTGTVAAKVKAAALAKYPGATVDRVETDSDGVYEAHIITKAGDHLEVQIDKSYKVTGTETGHGDHHGRHGGGHGDETALTGTTAAKVKAAALANYPGATVDRVETDSDGVYEAHIITKAGDHLEVQIDKSYKVTGTETFSGHGGRDHDGDADMESSTPSST